MYKIGKYNDLKENYTPIDTLRVKPLAGENISCWKNRKISTPAEDMHQFDFPHGFHTVYNTHISLPDYGAEKHYAAECDRMVGNCLEP